jgi:hypothetical protein
MRQITKREQANRVYFRQQIIRLLESLGAVRNDQPGYAYTLQTKLGMLSIDPYETWVACRWEDVARALEAIGRERMNRFSGKWNHHYDEPTFKRRAFTQQAIEDFRAAISRYLLDANGQSQAV